MITRIDLHLLLGELKEQGIDVSNCMKRLSQSNGVDIEVLKFINSHSELSLKGFYSKLRKTYNEKHSKLYINLVKEVVEPKDVLITLSSLLTQILIFSESVEDREMFLKHARCDEISGALTKYFTTYDLIPCMRLIGLIKADLKVMEFLSNNLDTPK